MLTAAGNLQKIETARRSSVANCFKYLMAADKLFRETLLMKKERTMKPPDETAESKKGVMSSQDLATEFLANERTFLAWVRTGIAVITLGFALAKVRVWLGELEVPNSPELAGSNRGESISLGVGMVLFGGVLVGLAALRYRVVNRQIERGEVKADRWLIVLVTIAVVILTCLTTLYLLLGGREM